MALRMNNLDILVNIRLGKINLDSYNEVDAKQF